MSDIQTSHEIRIGNLRYIQAMLSEMRTLAESERCDMLTYMIEMAYIETSDILRGQRPATVGSQASVDQRNAVA